MIINELDVIAVAIVPAEAESPLVIDSDGMLPLPVSMQRFELVSGRGREHAQLRGRVHLQRLPQRDSLEGVESPGMLVAKQLLGLLRGEALDHLNRVVRKALYVKRWICTLTERRPQVGERAVRRPVARTEDAWEGALPVLAELLI